MTEAANIEWIDRCLGFLEKCYTPILVHFGLLSNCLSVCVLFGTKLRYSSTSIYLGALMISNSGYLIEVFVSWLTMLNIGLHSQPGYCEFFSFLSNLSSFLSVWLVVAFTIERYVVVRWPLRRKSLCTVARAKVVVIGLMALAIPFRSPIILFYKVIRYKSTNVTYCYLDERWVFWTNIYYICDTVVTFVVPITAIVIFNALIVRNIYKSDRIRRTMTVDSTTSSSGEGQNTRDRISQTKVTKMLLIVSSAFLCSTCVFRLGDFFDNDTSPWVIRMQLLSYHIYVTSFGISFFLYCVSGQNFRNAMVRMFTRHSNRTRSETLLQMTNHGNQTFSADSTSRYSSTKRPHFDNERPKDAQETEELSTTKDEKPPISE